LGKSAASDVGWGNGLFPALDAVVDADLAVGLSLVLVVIIPRLLSMFLLDPALYSEEINLDRVDLLLLLFA
jgi:hypothetical protein